MKHPKIDISIQKRVNPFAFPATTSRNTLLEKTSWYITLGLEGHTGIGEVSPIPSLSLETEAEVEAALQREEWLVEAAEEALAAGKTSVISQRMSRYPSSVVFGLECAVLNLMAKKPWLLFPSAFTRGSASMAINGLVWMGPIEKMTADADTLLAKGFRCIKIKIGHLAWAEEFGLLQQLRARFPAAVLEIRVDANGAYDIATVGSILAQLQKLEIHSIEQPIAAGNALAIKKLISNSPIPIALDEELIGLRALEDRVLYLKTIKPHYLVLKPTLIGGLETTRQWIAACKATGTKWWLTSSLETAVGLNALAQFVFPYKNLMPQGLSTGTIFLETMESPIYLDGAELRMNPIGK